MKAWRCICSKYENLSRSSTNSHWFTSQGPKTHKSTPWQNSPAQLKRPRLVILSGRCFLTPALLHGRYHRQIRDMDGTINQILAKSDASPRWGSSKNTPKERRMVQQWNTATGSTFKSDSIQYPDLKPMAKLSQQTRKFWTTSKRK